MRSNSSTGPIRLGTRGSALALAQTALVIDRLRALRPDVQTTVVVVRTEGDVDQVTPLTVIGGRGVFTSALQDALRRGEIDAAVHSAKDLPSDGPSDLALIAFLGRDDARDVFISRHGRPLGELGPSPVVATSSRRRAFQVLQLRPDAQIAELRGNVDTRIRKAFESELDGIVLAAAGVARMGWSDLVTEYLPIETFIPAPGQGAIAVEARKGDDVAARLVAINETDVSRAVVLERAFLRGAGAGCTSPIAAHAVFDGGNLRLRAMVASDDGAHVEWANRIFPPDGAEQMALALSEEMVRAIREKSRPSVARAEAGSPTLGGVSVLVTGPLSDGRLAALLEKRGAVPILLPTIAIDGPEDATQFDLAVRRLVDAAYDWVAFTSKNAVERTLLRLEQIGSTGDALSAVTVAAVGDSTARVLRQNGVEVDVLPDEYCADGLVRALLRLGPRGKRVLIPQGNLARSNLADGLRRAGAVVDEVEAYRTVPSTNADGSVLKRVSDGQIDVATFLSPSSVDGLSGLLGGSLEALHATTVACIGPVTAEAVEAAGLCVDVMPSEPSVEALVDALESWMRSRSG